MNHLVSFRWNQGELQFKINYMPVTNFTALTAMGSPVREFVLVEDKDAEWHTVPGKQ